MWPYLDKVVDLSIILINSMHKWSTNLSMNNKIHIYLFFLVGDLQDCEDYSRTDHKRADSKVQNRRSRI